MSLLSIINNEDIKSAEVDSALMRLLDSVFILFLIFGTIAAGSSLPRLSQPGTIVPVVATISVFIAVLLIFSLRHFMSVSSVVLSLITVLWMHVVVNFYSLGLASMGLTTFIFLLVLVSLFLSIRTSLIVFILMVVTLITVSILVCKGIIPHTIDANQYLTSYSSWLAQITNFCMFALCTIYCLSIMKRRLIRSLLELRLKTDELTRANETLRLEQQRIKTIIETAPVSITTSDLYGNITMCNRSTVEMHGYTGESEVVGKSALELLANDD